MTPFETFLTVAAAILCGILLLTIVFWVVDAVRDAWAEYKWELERDAFKRGMAQNAPPF